METIFERSKELNQLVYFAHGVVASSARSVTSLLAPTREEPLLSAVSQFNNALLGLAFPLMFPICSHTNNVYPYFTCLLSTVSFLIKIMYAQVQQHSHNFPPSTQY